MKWSIAILGLFCALGSTAHAQAVTAPVLADVVQDLILTSTGQTSFGTIGNGAHTERIDPAAPTPTQSTAEFTLTIGAGDVVLTCSAEVTLSEPASSAAMTFTPEVSFAGTDDQASSTPTPCNTAGSSSGSQETWLWLGGTLAVGANQAPGSYSGVFNFSAAYQ